MIKKIIALPISILFFSASLTFGANWLYFLENERGDKFYIDLDSIQLTPLPSIRVSQKEEPADSATISALVSERELDCTGKQIKTLAETVYFKDGTSTSRTGSNQYRMVSATDIEESLMELVCSLKKSADQ